MDSAHRHRSQWCEKEGDVIADDVVRRLKATDTRAV